MSKNTNQVVKEVKHLVGKLEDMSLFDGSDVKGTLEQIKSHLNILELTTLDGVNVLSFKMYEEYFYIDGTTVVRTNWHDTETDNLRLELGNAFKSKDEAKERLSELRTYAMLKKYSCDFRAGEKNYVLYYDTEDGKLKASSDSTVVFGNICFAGREIALMAAELAGKDNVIKYYLHVSDEILKGE